MRHVKHSPCNDVPSLHLCCCIPFIGMTVNGFTNLYLLTLEKRFQLTSTDVGFVAASNDVAGILLTALVSFYGTYGNKIKWLGYGSVITGKEKNPLRFGSKMWSTAFVFSHTACTLPRGPPYTKRTGVLVGKFEKSLEEVLWSYFVDVAFFTAKRCQY